MREIEVQNKVKLTAYTYISTELNTYVPEI